MELPKYEPMPGADYDLLKSSPLAAELTDEQCKILADVMYVRHLQHGEILIQEGFCDDSLHLVTDGGLAVVKTSGEGEEQLTVLKRGSLAGAMGFIDGQEHSATLRAIGDAQIYILERHRLEELVAKHPMIVYMVMRAIVRAVHSIVRNMNNQYIQMTNYITRQRGRY